jgi:SOS-response transcriptional repressor LexA
MSTRQARAQRPMTDRQKALLGFLRAFYEANDQLPPTQVIAGNFGWASTNSAQEHLVALWRRGYLERNAVGKWKFTEKSRAYTRQEQLLEQIPAVFPTGGRF